MNTVDRGKNNYNSYKILKSLNGTRGKVVFFFSSRSRHTRSKRDWSSDVCSSDLFLGDASVAARLARGMAHDRRVGAAVREVVRRRPAQCQRELPRPPRARRQGRPSRVPRSEERRVGKEYNSKGLPHH